jgi:hypothetical protein
MQGNGNPGGGAAVGTPYLNGVEYFTGVGPITGGTIPRFNQAGGVASNATADPTASVPAGTYSGPYSTKQFLGEPFAVFLGMVLLLFLLKFFSERSGILGVPSHVRIGGYNFLAVGISAAIFIVLMKIIFNAYKIPGLTEFTNAL